MTAAGKRALRDALRDRMRGREVGTVAAQASVDPKTLRRLLTGPTFGEETAFRVCAVLRIDPDQVLADSLRPQEGQNGAGRSKMEQNGANLSPVVGWKQAAQVLDVSRWTLRRARAAHRCTLKPWWPSPQACLDWYNGLAVTGW